MSDIALTSRRLGSGPPLLVVLQLDRDGWGPVLDRLAREREVVAVDLPGFGDSPSLPQGTTPTVEALAAAVAEWLPGAGLSRPPVVGNSLGGAVALELARSGAVGSAVELSPIGLWTRPEAAYALGSLRVAHAMAQACAEHPGLDRRTPDRAHRGLLAARRPAMAYPGGGGRRGAAQPGPLARLRADAARGARLPAAGLHP